MNTEFHGSLILRFYRIVLDHCETTVRSLVAGLCLSAVGATEKLHTRKHTVKIIGAQILLMTEIVAHGLSLSNCSRSRFGGETPIFFSASYFRRASFLCQARMSFAA